MTPVIKTKELFILVSWMINSSKNLNNQHWANMRSNMMIKKVYTIRYIHIFGNMWKYVRIL